MTFCNRPRCLVGSLAARPDLRVKITEEYDKLVGRVAYFWEWPMVNICNRRLAFAPVKEAVRSGPLVSPPLNQIAMFTDYRFDRTHL